MKRKLRGLVGSTVPKKWRLPIWFHWQRFTGGPEARQWQSELEELRRWSSPETTAIDIGANEGLYSYKFAQWFESVEAFEPNPSASRSLRDYRSPRIRLHEIALSASTGHTNLHVPISPSGREEVGWGALDPKAFQTTQQLQVKSVVMTTLDSFRFDRISVIKIDVEGHECEVLAGALDTISRCRPVLLLEVKSSSRLCIDEFFRTLGYTFYFWDSTHLMELKDGIGAWNNSHENIFVIPNEKAGLLIAAA